MKTAVDIFSTFVPVGDSDRMLDLKPVLKVAGYKLELSVHLHDDDPERIMSIDATYISSTGEHAAELELEGLFTEEDSPYFDIDKLRITNAKTGLGTEIFAKIITLSNELGYEQLSVSAREVGSYFWARAGFVPSQSTWPDLRKQIVKRLAAENGLNDYEVPARDELPNFAKESDPEFLVDIKWFGTLDLKDPEQMQHCKEYLTEKMGADLNR